MTPESRAARLAEDRNCLSTLEANLAEAHAAVQLAFGVWQADSTPGNTAILLAEVTTLRFAVEIVAHEARVLRDRQAAYAELDARDARGGVQ